MDELNILRTAILNEVEGYQFYSLAAMRAEDESVKDAFNHLAKEEQQHESWLRKMYRQLSDNQTPTLEGLDVTEAPSPRIFRPGNVGTESGSLEISVYKIGILMEKESMVFYRNAAKEAQTPELKELLQRLAEWEDSHLESLQNIYDTLKEEWWGQQGFSPA
ncbi:ferritin-like domain-containing protein [Dethiobacter alkaliphilus]|uniref:Rubrerythrin n=1 Tax=Dethiobacter alkaliphilus AHT 1 TaxID=555088 RepID=C0GC28_DETAL|nr:ferritin family protein [Dethiobacter alkaliphilus]EEG78763.1 Rubrerythrin [Dethiobacter alkaliphilus AHT 1]